MSSTGRTIASVPMVLLMVLALLVAACGGSSSDEATPAATPTTAEATATPAPTPAPTETPVPTPTPVPFDLSVSVVDDVGEPIGGATVGLGDLEPVQTDAAGVASWADLPGDPASLSASAQGYLPADATATLDRGSNEVAITLMRDPYGVLPNEACAAGEDLLYVEDFQDDSAQGWQEIEFRAQGWGLAEEPDVPENLVAVFDGTDQVGPQFHGGIVFDDGVWRLRARIDGSRTMSLNWLHGIEPYELDGQEVFDARYQILLGTEGPGGIQRLQQPVVNIPVASSGFRMEPGRWYQFEISTFEGQTEVWVDGEQIMAYTDPKPLGPGTIGLEFSPPAGEGGPVYFDDLSVCDLTAPFTSIVEVASE